MICQITDQVQSKRPNRNVQPEEEKEAKANIILFAKKKNINVDGNRHGIPSSKKIEKNHSWTVQRACLDATKRSSKTSIGDRAGFSHSGRVETREFVRDKPSSAAAVAERRPSAIAAACGCPVYRDAD